MRVLIADELGRYTPEFLRALEMYNYITPHHITGSMLTMNDTTLVPPIPTKQSILLQREAYARGAYCAGINRADAERAARHAYPLPDITRPRVVTLSDGTQYRRVDGVLQYHDRMTCGWTESAITDEKIDALAGLLANPTETVPGE